VSDCEWPAAFAGGVGASHAAPRDAGRGRAVQVDSIKFRVESAPGVCNQRLILYYDEPLSNFAFKFNLRCYAVAGGPGDAPDADGNTAAATWWGGAG
jgi:hypothetical protein